MINSEVRKILGNCINEAQFIEIASKILFKRGFNPSNSITGVCLCRDELCQSALILIKNIWKNVFNFSSLGGLYLSGITGFKAFLSHGPVIDGFRNAVVFLFTHVGIDKTYKIGFCQRRGIESSTACGALFSLHSELEKKALHYGDDDYEQNFLRNRISKEIGNGQPPELFKLTELTLNIARTDIEKAINKVLKKEKLNCAVVSGIQIHYGEENLILPKESVLFLNGKRELIDIPR